LSLAGRARWGHRGPLLYCRRGQFAGEQQDIAALCTNDFRSFICSGENGAESYRIIWLYCFRRSGLSSRTKIVLILPDLVSSGSACASSGV